MLIQEQIDFYHKSGYLSVEDVLTPEEVGELRTVTDEFVEKSREVTDHDAMFDLEPGHTPENPRLRRLKSPILHHETYRKTLHNEKILMVRQFHVEGKSLELRSRILSVEFHIH